MRMGGHSRQLFAAVVAVAAIVAAGLATASEGAASATPIKFDPRNFGAAGANKWFPLQPGLQSVRQGFVSVGHRRLPHRRVFTVTDVTRMIAGVRAVAVLDQDINGGEVAEQALDYVAADRQGNLWFFGSYTESYEGGQFVNASDAWLAGVRGAAPGILLPGKPRTGTAPFTQATIPGESATTGQVVKTGQKHCVPFKCYQNVVVVQEGSPSEPGVVEWKYYAPGVGGIRTEPRTGGEQETEALLNLRQLSPPGLAELSAEALKLDKHARVTAPDVFGRSPAAKRTP
jgi:hypothetical protein